MNGRADFWAWLIGSALIAAMVAWIVLTGTDPARG